ncbi:MAG: hypothetical protein Q4D92_03610 [Slackia sp.]|nr:hypothetical protein [Slackia sp.]
MDPVLAEIYSTVLDAAPFVIAGYALLFLVLCAYVVFIMTKLKRTEKKLAALEEHIDELK